MRGSGGVLSALGVVFLGLGGWAAVDAASFMRVLANFGPENVHLVHDFAACSATFGLGLLIAVRLPAWRAPVGVTGFLAVLARQSMKERE